MGVEMGNRVIKEQIRTKSKTVVNTITAEQREEIIKQGREEGKQDFSAKIAASFDIPSAIATQATSHHQSTMIREGTTYQKHSIRPTHRVTIAIIIAQSTHKISISLRILTLLQKDFNRK